MFIPKSLTPYADMTGIELRMGMFMGPGLQLRAWRAFGSAALPLLGTAGFGTFVPSLSISICRANRQEKASFPELWKVQRASTPKEAKAAGRDIMAFGARGFP